MDEKRKDCQVYQKTNRRKNKMKNSKIQKLIVNYKEIKLKLKKNQNIVNYTRN